MTLPNDDPVLDLKAVARMLGIGHKRALMLAPHLPFIWRTSERGQYRALKSEVLKYRESMRVNRGAT